MGIGPEAVTRRGTPGKWMAALASALLLCACAATEPESEKNIFSDTPVSFDAFGRWDDDAPGIADTRTTSNGVETTFDNGDAIGVMAYYLPEGATMDATAPNFMYNQKVTYATSTAAGTTGASSEASESTSGASGASAASGSSASGTWAYSPVKYWPVSGKLSFYAYYPFAESTDGSEKVSWHPLGNYDILWGKNETTDKKQTVQFNFSHKLVKLRINLHSGNGISPEITKILIEGADADNVLDNKATLDVRTGEITFSTDGEPSVTLPGTKVYDKYDECVYIKPVSKIKVTVVTAKKEYSPVIVNLPEAVPGKSYLLTFHVDGEVITLESSNSYLLDPSRTDTVFEIPVDRVNTFWSHNDVNKQLSDSDSWTAKIIWSDHNNLVKFFNSESGSLSDTFSGKGDEKIRVVPQGKSGNALIGITTDGGKTYLWSWHLWITDYDPETGKTIELADGALYMDRNLGALTDRPTVPDSPESQSMFDLYYQYGRKDPFPRYSLSGYDGYNNHGKTKIGSIAESVQEPNAFWFTGDSGKHNWANDSNAEIWNKPDWWTESKSLFDPCPPGWCLPIRSQMPSSLHCKFTWSESLKCYMFSDATYPATGGHNYSNFDGSTSKSVNAIHFAGSRTYFWSSSNAEGSEDAFYNGLVISEDLPKEGVPYQISGIEGARAYGLNVRCVKEKAKEGN